MDAKKTRVWEKLQHYGQEHVANHLGDISEEQINALCDEVEAIDMECVTGLHRDLVLNKATIHNDGAATLERLEDEFTVDAVYCKSNGYGEIGLELIKQGAVNCVILAGGQGSRLGFDHPKGMYNIGLKSEKSIF